MTGTISTFSCVFLLYPCALKQRFNRLPHFAKPVFFARIFVQGWKMPGAAVLRRRAAGA
ncbi:hypothetical protein ABIE30_000398 [Janthinobacterium lividum]|uniref:hypothetical protein n=1 Tax=Janthinobacterium lividum TaxID=29581 RepID=UPI003D24C746